MAKGKSPLFGVVQVRFLKAARFKKGIALVLNPAPWVVAGWRALKGRQYGVIATLVSLAREWDNLSADEKAKYGGRFNEYVKAKFREKYSGVLADLGLDVLPRRVRVPKGSAYNEAFYSTIKAHVQAVKARLVAPARA